MSEINKKSVSGALVTLSSQSITTVIQLSSTVILARLLTPDDYGVMAMVLAVTAFAGLFRDLGLSAAAIQKKNLSLSQQSNLFWLNVIAGLLLTIIFAATSPLIALYYQRPEVLTVCLWMSLSFVIGSVGAQHRALLTRQMSYTRLAISNVSGQILGLVVAIITAMSGAGFWALVWANLTTHAVTSISLFYLSSFRPTMPRRRHGTLEMLRFGAHVTGFEFVNYFQRNLDSLLLGRYWGGEILGLYSRAYQLLMFPLVALRGPINTVAFPALSQLQDEPTKYRDYFCKVVWALAILTMPLTAFLFVYSHEVIVLALGAQWLGAAPIFSWLAITGLIQPVAGLRGLLLLSSGQSKRYLNWGIINTICVLIAFSIGIRWSAEGIAKAYAISNYLILIPSLYYCFYRSHVTPSDFLRAVWRPMLAATLSVAILYFLDEKQAEATVLFLLLRSLCFGCVFLIVYAILPNGFRELFENAKNLKKMFLNR